MNIAELTDFKDTLATYRVAKKAREKGFYCICPHVFLNENTIMGGWYSSPNPTEDDIQEYVINLEKHLIAPTLGIIHVWLKKFHSISVHTEPVKTDNESGLFEFSPYLVIGKKERTKTTTKYIEEAEAFGEGIFDALCRLPNHI